MENKEQITNNQGSNIKNFYYQASIIEQNCHEFNDNKETMENALAAFNELYNNCKQVLYNQAEFLATEELRGYKNSSAMMASTFISLVSAVIASLICITTGIGIMMSLLIVLSSMIAAFAATTAISSKKDNNIIILNQDELKHYTDCFYNGLLASSGIQKCYDDVIKSINEITLNNTEENNYEPNLELSKDKVLTKSYK